MFRSLIGCVGGKRDGNWAVVLPGSLLLILSLRDLGSERLGPSARHRGARGCSVLQETSLQGEAEAEGQIHWQPEDCDLPPETSQYLKEKPPQEIPSGSVSGTVSLLTLCTTESMECWLYDGIWSQAQNGDAELLECIILLLK